MKAKNCIILVPVYKTTLSLDEAASLHQLERILGRWDIRFVCPVSLDMTSYDSTTQALFEKERFEDAFFDSIEGYNRLMKDNAFYRRFAEYEYMLIYQLDAWVFSDQLAEWCAQGYDYIGAPWFSKFKTYEEGYKLWRCGNGGLSLRKVEKFIRCTSSDADVYSLRSLVSHANRHFLRNIIRYIRYPNNMGWFIRHLASTWEDYFFCCDLSETRHALHCPEPETAARFSFEASPTYLFSLTGETLPFGCHAWHKYQFDDFWSKHIKYDNDADI